MDTIFLYEKGKTKMVAHRGLSGIELENTLAAFVAAGNRDYYGIETDVHVTKDGKYIIFHDDESGRVANANLRMEGSDFEQLRKLWYLERGTDGGYSDMQRPLCLQEYLRVIRRYEKVAVIELKNPMKRENIFEIADICASEYDTDKIVFISFCYENLKILREKLPAQHIQFLTGEITDALIADLKKDGFGLDVAYPALSEEWMKKLKENKIEVNCWTCDDPAEAKKLIGWGVDMITTNILQ